MIATALRLLTSRIAGPIASALCVALILVSVGQCTAKNGEARRADRAEASLETERDRLRTCRGNVSALEAGIGEQNAKIEAARREGAALVERADAAARGALKAQAAADAKVRRLLAVKPTGAGKCADLDAVDAALLETLQ